MTFNELEVAFNSRYLFRPLEVVDNFKLLGVIIRSDMKWYDNTNYICQKGYARLWLLRRLKNLGAGVLELLDV